MAASACSRQHSNESGLALLKVSLTFASHFSCTQHSSKALACSANRLGDLASNEQMQQLENVQRQYIETKQLHESNGMDAFVAGESLAEHLCKDCTD